MSLVASLLGAECMCEIPDTTIPLGCLAAQRVHTCMLATRLVYMCVYIFELPLQEVHTRVCVCNVLLHLAGLHRMRRGRCTCSNNFSHKQNSSPPSSPHRTATRPGFRFKAWDKRLGKWNEWGETRQQREFLKAVLNRMLSNMCRLCFRKMTMKGLC